MKRMRIIEDIDADFQVIEDNEQKSETEQQEKPGDDQDGTEE